jgi:hypothetical protein
MDQWRNLAPFIWDGASIPRSPEVKEFLHPENSAGRVQLELLPFSRPQLNAAFPVWAWLKGGQLKTVCGSYKDFEQALNG